MALTITYGTAANSTASGPTLAASVTASVGDLVFLVCSADNAGAAGASSVSSITDAAGNSWNRAFTDVVQTAGVANDGTTLSVWYSLITNALSASTVTVNYSPDTASKTVQPVRVTKSSSETIGIVSAGAGATGNGTSHSITATGVVSGNTIFGFTALENDAQPGADTDTTNGTWNGGAGTIASAGNAFLSQSVRAQHKTVTATGDQTFNTSSGAARDYATNYVIIGTTAAVDLATSGDIEIDGAVPIAGTSGGATLAAAGNMEFAGATPSFNASLNITVRPGLMKFRGFRPTVEPSNVRWPTMLPIPLLATHAFEPRPQILRTEMEMGAARQRRLSRVTPHEAPFSLILDQGEKATLETWVDEIADYGGQYFAIELQTATGYRTHTVRLTGEIDYKQIRKDRWLASGTFEMQERPMLSEVELDALLGELS